ncbi:hypothetical protein D3C84_1116350 [compost metagenome]
MAGAGDHGFAGQFGAVQEEEQSDGDVGDPAESHCDLALGGQQGGGGHDGDQRQGEIVG